MVSAAVCQPLAASPPKTVPRAASSSRWKGCGSNSAAKSLISLRGRPAAAPEAEFLARRRNPRDSARSWLHSDAQEGSAAAARWPRTRRRRPPRAALIRPNAASATRERDEDAGRLAAPAQRQPAAAGCDRQPRRNSRSAATAAGRRPATRNRAPCRGRTGRRTGRPRADSAIPPRASPDRCRTATATRRGNAAAARPIALAQRRRRWRRRSRPRAARGRGGRRRYWSRPWRPAARPGRTPAAPADIRGASRCRSRRSPPARIARPTPVAIAMVRLVCSVMSAATAPTRRMSRNSVQRSRDAAKARRTTLRPRPQIGGKSDAADRVIDDHRDARRRRRRAAGTAPARR